MDPTLLSSQMCLCSNFIRFLTKPDVSWPKLWHLPNVFWCVLWPGQKLFPVTISHTEWVPSNVAFLNLPFLSHHDCQEGFWETSTHSKAGTCSTGSPPEPSQVSSIHETVSPTVPTLLFLFLCRIPIGCCAISTDFFPKLYWWRASIKHPVGYLSSTLKCIIHGALMMSQNTFPFHGHWCSLLGNPFKPLKVVLFILDNVEEERAAK